jgi:hypothetical protein
MRQNARRFNRPRAPHRLFARFRARSRFEASIVRFDHSHCIQPAKRTWTGSVRNRGFVVMAWLAMVCRAGAWCALLACSAANAAGAWCALTGCAAAAELEPPRPPAKPVCLTAAETREMVKSHRLIEPFAALKFAAAQRKAEALSARLCRSGDDFVYVITLLHRDGRLVHVEMEAATGKIASRPLREPRESHEAHEPPAKN